jgi:hypothetical protein
LSVVCVAKLELKYEVNHDDILVIIVPRKLNEPVTTRLVVEAFGSDDVAIVDVAWI